MGVEIYNEMPLDLVQKAKAAAALAGDQSTESLDEIRQTLKMHTQILLEMGMSTVAPPEAYPEVPPELPPIPSAPMMDPGDLMAMMEEMPPLPPDMPTE